MGFERSRIRPRGKHADDSARRATAVAKNREAMNRGPVFATVMPSQCYHASPRCIMYANHSRRLGGVPVRYPNAKEANAGGHLRPCARCVDMINVETNGVIIPVTFDQMDTMVIIAMLKERTEKVGVSCPEISTLRGVSQMTTQSIVRSLSKRELVRQKRWPSGRAVDSTIDLTPLGYGVVRNAPSL